MRDHARSLGRRSFSAAHAAWLELALQLALYARSLGVVGQRRVHGLLGPREQGRQHGTLRSKKASSSRVYARRGGLADVDLGAIRLFPSAQQQRLGIGLDRAADALLLVGAVEIAGRRNAVITRRETPRTAR